jgi:hypothetical protein
VADETFAEIVARYGLIETNERVHGLEPDLLTRFRWRADRRARKLDAQRSFPFYRHEVQRLDGRWAVVVMQNVASGPEVSE